MNLRVFFTLQLAVFALPFAASAAVPTAHAQELFVRRIQPLFKEKCLACHGDDPKKLKGGLDMRTLGGLLKGGESEKPSIIPGKPDTSPLWLAVTREGDAENWAAMPPKENDKLTKEQFGWVKEWIAGGAPWPDAKRLAEIAKANADKWSAEDGIPVKTSGGLSAEWTNRRYKPENLWAYQPVRKPPVPRVAADVRRLHSPQTQDPRPQPQPSQSLLMSAATGSPIDAFLAAKWPAGLKPAPLADRRTLIRRATFDLLGLPPTPEEVAAFLADKDSDERAFAKLVDRLLASPHYGEQMARHWLDIARYADSSGFANDYARGSTWRYRDYVVRAFNTDKPYDQFIREQLAGDELAEDSKPQTPNSELLVATGFLRQGPWELTGMEVAKVARQRFLDDVTDSVGQVFLAHPLQCARCHDHKFDPVPTRDYYALQACFATTQLSERDAPFLPEENVTGFEERTYLEARRQEHLATLKRLDDKLLANAQAWFAEKKIDPAKWNAAVTAARETEGKGPRRESQGAFAIARNKLAQQGVPESEFPPKLHGFTPEDYGLERVARKGLERLRWEFDRFQPVAFAVHSGRTPDVKSVNSPTRMPANRMTAGELEQTAILTGGDPFAAAAKVEPGALSAITPSLRIANSIAGRRLDLANWIASPTNPLTARVMVNRIWQWHFGQALAGNPNNFGATGKKPTHPELLDWLAATFVERGWSVKAMHRLVMTSEAYRRRTVISEEVISNQSAKPAAKSPAPLGTDSLITNYLLFKPRRLAAEELRDAMLRVSGELNPALGGIPVRPEINPEAALQPRQVMGTFAEAWQPSPKPEQRHRRSVYALKLRGAGDPFMEVFNAPSPDLSCEIRDASTVTPQVFALFNSQATYARALALANRLVTEMGAKSVIGNRQSQILNRAFELAFNRAPKPDELKTCLAHWDAMTARHRTLKFERHLPPRSVTREAVEENTGEKFRFTETLEAAADFVPDLQPADAPPELRGLAEVCLVLLNASEFAYVY